MSVFDLPHLTPLPDARSGPDAVQAASGLVPPTVDERVRAAASNSGADVSCAYLAALWLLLQRYARYEPTPSGVRVTGIEGRDDEWLRGVPDPSDAFAKVVTRVASTLEQPAADDRVASREGPTTAGVPLARAAVEFCWNVEHPERHKPGHPPTVVVAVDDRAVGGTQLRVLASWPAPQLTAAVEADYLRLLDAVAGDERPVAQIDAFATVAESAPASTQPGPRLDEIVAAHAARTPDAVAVRGQEAVSYRELVSRARALCAVLLSRGVQVEDRVGVCTERNEHLAVGILGVMMCGAAFVPLAPEDPRPRRDEILRDAGIGVVVSHGAMADEFADSADVVRLDGHDQAEEAEPVPTGGSTAAYVLYTSGSSGRPKGVVVEHRQLLAYVAGFLDRLCVDHPLDCAMVQPLTVDSCLTCVGAAWVTGGELQILDRATALDLERLTAWATQHPADVLKIAPSHLRALQTCGDVTAVAPKRALVVGGEASDWHWLQELQDAVPCSVVNHYGPTETTVGVLMLPVAEQRGRSWVTAALGRPLRGCEVAVVDRYGAEAPAGIRGELVVRGRLVARGYYQEPPGSGFRPWRGGPAYWTGDEGLREVDGVICFAGRSDDQVKVRGFRVELGEVERAVNAHPRVAQAVAAMHIDPVGHTSLGCAVRATGGQGEPTPEELAAHCRELLPEHMVPSRWAVVVEIPRTPHGKVDRRAVIGLLDGAGVGRAPEADRAQRPSSAASAEAPDFGDLRETLVRIWQDLLGRSFIGEHLNFFDAGGHSLLLIDLHRAIEDRTGRAVELLDLFQHTTIAAQLELLRGESRPPGTPVGGGGGRDRRQEALARRRRQRQKDART